MESLTDRERYEDLRLQAREIGGELTKDFCFNADGMVAGSRLALATYRRPYWLAREAKYPAEATLMVELPRQFRQLEMAIARNEQIYQQQIHAVRYGNERPAIELMERRDFEPQLKQLARQAGGSLELRCYGGKTYAYYYRYVRLKTATVFVSVLKHEPYHSAGRHRYKFWLPIDYGLLRQMLEHDAQLYALLPPEMLRPKFPAREGGEVAISEFLAEHARIAEETVTESVSRLAETVAILKAAGPNAFSMPFQEASFVKREPHHGY